MSFAEFAVQPQPIQLLQRSLERGRLGHAYLFSGARLDVLECLARTLAKTLHCQSAARTGENPRPPTDSCDRCLACRKVESGNHPDVHWLRPESKSRAIVIDQVRELSQTMHLKPTEAEYKVGVLVAADRLNLWAANAFLKTLEEPPPKSVLLLLSTRPQQMLETVLSRCLRLTFSGEGVQRFEPEQVEWVRAFSAMAVAVDRNGLLGRYRLLGSLLAKLVEMKAAIEKAMSATLEPEDFDDEEEALEGTDDARPATVVEAEYRRQRGDLLLGLEWWLRDVWLLALGLNEAALAFPDLAASARTVAQRISPADAAENLRLMEQLQGLLSSNVQEALAMEVAWLKLKF